MSETLAERLIRGAVWAVSVADHHADTLTPRQINELYAAGDAAREAETALKEADHPTAEDYRNRAERAEQECAEKDAEIARMREALDQCPARHSMHGCPNADYGEHTQENPDG